jgi:hypothetical protein
MTDQPKPITPGSGTRLRAYYQRLTVLTGILGPLLIIAVLAIAHSIDGPALTTTLGVTVLVIATALLLTAITRARAAITADAITAVRIRSAGRLAMAAMVVAFAGALITVVASILQQANGFRNGIGFGIIAAALCVAPGLVAANVTGLSRRLT